MHEQEFFRAKSKKDDFSDPTRAADALWQFITSVKSVSKQDGQVVAFNLNEMETSIARAFQTAGVSDEFSMRSVSERVMSDLQKKFDGIHTPRTQDIFDTIVSALDHPTLIKVKEAYQAQRLTPSTSSPMSPSLASLMNEPTPSSPVRIVGPSTPTGNVPVSGTTPTAAGETYTPRRRRMNDERKALTHKFQVGEYEGYLTIGLYDDGEPGEIFITMNKEGSMLNGLMDAFATAISIGLQYGVPMKILVKKFVNVRFEPNGPTPNPNIPKARSIIDYIFRWLALKFLTPEERQSVLGLLEETEAVITLNNVDGAQQSRLLNGV